jgi:hypothetical protein
MTASMSRMKAVMSQFRSRLKNKVSFTIGGKFLEL